MYFIEFSIFLLFCAGRVKFSSNYSADRFYLNEVKIKSFKITFNIFIFSLHYKTTNKNYKQKGKIIILHHLFHFLLKIEIPAQFYFKSSNEKLFSQMKEKVLPEIETFEKQRKEFEEEKKRKESKKRKTQTKNA